VSADNAILIVEQEDGTFTGFHYFVSDTEYSVGSEPPTVEEVGNQIFKGLPLRRAITEAQMRPTEYGYTISFKGEQNGQPI
jgi:hypothetical protein